MSLSCKIKNVEEWKAVLDAISTITEDAMFIVNTNGISFRGIDSSHVALLDITFPKSSFEKFEGQTSFFGLKVDDFKTISKPHSFQTANILLVFPPPTKMTS